MAALLQSQEYPVQGQTQLVLEKAIIRDQPSEIEAKKVIAIRSQYGKVIHSKPSIPDTAPLAPVKAPECAADFNE